MSWWGWIGIWSLVWVIQGAIPEEDSIDGEKEHYFVKWAEREGK